MWAGTPVGSVAFHVSKGLENLCGSFDIAIGKSHASAAADRRTAEHAHSSIPVLHEFEGGAFVSSIQSHDDNNIQL